MVKEALLLQRIELAPERAERIAAALMPALEAAAQSAPPLEFEIDPTSHAAALERCKA